MAQNLPDIWSNFDLHTVHSLHLNTTPQSCPFTGGQLIAVFSSFNFHFALIWAEHRAANSA
jgi:hypothetical protein